MGMCELSTHVGCGHTGPSMMELLLHRIKWVSFNACG